VTVLPITQEIAEKFAIIRGGLMTSKQSKHLAVPKQHYDLFIAATALYYDMMLFTHNLKDYQGIPDLKVYQSL
jgi:predicted nucleic acid-binding protein